MPAIRKACEPKCEQSFSAYRACLDRVKAKGVGSCDGQYFDFLHCIDECVRSLTAFSLGDYLFVVEDGEQNSNRLLLLLLLLQSVPQIMKHLK